MMQALLISTEKNVFHNLESVLNENNVQTLWVKTGNNALSMVAERDFDLIVADEVLPDMTGLDLLKKIIAENPMLNLALVSRLSSEDFHEASEGMGILMPLSSLPGKSEAKKLVSQLNNILNLTGKGKNHADI